MSPWSKVLLLSLPLAFVATAAFRFIQHTDTEYSLWVTAFGETAQLLAARCTAAKSADVCARAEERRRLAQEFRDHRNAVLSWWWPALVAMLSAWLASAVSAAAVAWAAWQRRGPTPQNASTERRAD